MNPFDVVIIIILSCCLVAGFFRGLIKGLASIIGVLGGFYAAYTYYVEVAKLLSGWISDFGYLNIVSFLIIFCGVFIIISILGVVIRYLLKTVSLGWVDRICGAGFGAIIGILIVSVLLIVLTAFLPKGAPFIKNSILSPHVTLVAEKMVKAVPENMKDKFVSGMEEFKKAWEESS